MQLRLGLMQVAFFCVLPTCDGVGCGARGGKRADLTACQRRRFVKKPPLPSHRPVKTRSHARTLVDIAS